MKMTTHLQAVSKIGICGVIPPVPMFLVLWFIGKHKDCFISCQARHLHGWTSAHNVKNLLVFCCQQLFMVQQTVNYIHTQSDHIY